MRRSGIPPHLEPVSHDPGVRAIVEHIESGWTCAGVGGAGGAASLILAAIALRASRPIVCCVAHLDDADAIEEELLSHAIDARKLPALEVLPGESGVSLELFAERLSVVRQLVAGAPPRVLIAPVQALMQAVPSPARLDDLSMTLAQGDGRGPAEIVRWLDRAGYSRVDSIEEAGDFAVRGGIIDVFPPGGASSSAGQAAGSAPVRLDFFGDELDSINEVDIETMGSDRRVDAVEFLGASLEAVTSHDSISVLELLAPGSVGVVVETAEVTEQGRGYYERVADSGGVFGPPAVFKLLGERAHAICELNQFSAPAWGGDVIELPGRPLMEFSRDAAEAIRELGALASSHRVVVCCQNDGEGSRLRELLDEFAPDATVEIEQRYLHRGCVWGDAEESSGDGGGGGDAESGAVAYIPHHELFHRYETRRRVRRVRGGQSKEAFYDLEPGDFVVHSDHGIAKYLGLKSMKPKGVQATAEEAAEARMRGESAGAKRASEEYLTLEFAGRTKLHVPVTQIDKVQKYIGGGKGGPRLSTIGGKRWANQKANVKESVRDLAAEMLRVHAAREALPGVRYPADTAWQREFEAEFPFQETEDQLAALVEIKRDMSESRPMDRLLCGDVGYGKTELAIRAAFKAAEFGKQVGVLVPTTLLADQHERTFRQRFADYPFRVESLSRLKERKQVNDVLAATRRGEVDILIGTHRLLSNDVRFSDLGLVIVDEEQRFGVEHKQKLLELRATVDVLTLSATPIPRTLHMAMLGLRDISSLTTPPLDRRAVVTEVLPFNEKRIARAISREMAREGQVFFVHNRVRDIQSVAGDVQRLAPDARIVVGHGQMTPGELEDVMGRFVRREADILVATTIIESGIDIPTANTMIINNADMFGLADLHQLRGRVGRYKHRAYCYLMLPADRPAREKAVKRLRAIEEFSMLGAGFKIAMRDLEIRGAGNLLGAEQSGHIAAVGYDMYCQLLEQAAKELRNERTARPSETTVELGITGQIPKAYIPSEKRRLEAYRRIATAATRDELAAIEEDLTQAYGEPPEQARRLIEIAEVRVAASALGVRSMTVRGKDLVLRCEDPEGVRERLSEAKGTVRVLPPERQGGLVEVYYRPPGAYLDGGTLLVVLRARLGSSSEATAVA